MTTTAFGPELNMLAGGNIAPASFVKVDTSADEQVLQAGSTDTPIGVVGPDQEFTPGLAGSSTTVAYDTVVKPNVRVKQYPNTAMLILGSGGCTRGDYLKPDASGYGVTASSGNVVGAWAIQSGVAGAQVLVCLLPRGSKMP